MNSNMEKYYATNKFFLLRIGGWPYQSKIVKILLPCLLSMVQYSALVLEALSLYDTWGDIDMDTAIEFIINSSIVLGCNVKLFNIVVNNNKFRQIWQLMNYHWGLFNSESEHHTLKYYANIGRKVTNYLAVYFSVYMTLYMSIPFIPKILDIVIPLNESRPLVYVHPSEFRMDKEKYYYPIMFHNYIILTITTIIIFTIDTTYIVCVLHVCSLFTVISRHLENITGNADIDIKKIHKGTHCDLFMEKHSSATNDYRELMTCLKKHQFALEYAQILDSMFSHVTFILLLLNVLLLSLTGIRLLNNIEETGETIKYIFMCFIIIIHVIYMCIPGQLLIDQSTEIFNKAYCSRWYTFSIKTKGLLRILLYRSLDPCALTAGNTFVMSMTMCSSVLQTAMSYFMAFLSLR